MFYVKLEAVRFVFSWMPSHCGIQGNKKPDQLAKAGFPVEICCGMYLVALTGIYFQES